MRILLYLQPKVYFFAVLTLALLVGSVRQVDAQESGGVVPNNYESGSFFNQKLGTALRFNYHTQGYGTQDDVFSLGAMKNISLDDASVVFIDGQGTLSDDFGGGFNLGVGYRQLTMSTSPMMSLDPQRILGLGFWTDGQSTSSDNFFTQLGFSLESLGDSFDVRLNGHFPLERTKSGDSTLLTFDSPMFVGNNLVNETSTRSIDTAHSVVDGELAKRINDLEAWAFIGGYQLGGGGVDATGYRLGVRGYAVPDLALSLQVTDDDQYATNVMFGVTWFIGRTNKCNGPCETLLDRFREPVLRNDFIATTHRSETINGDALTDATTGDVLRFVHVDDGATGGSGTFESPLDTLAGATTAGLDNDTILVHAGSNLSGQYVAKAGQRILGEGGNIQHTVNATGLGVIILPETSTGALAGSRPTINGGAGDVFTLANDNELNNFTITGGSRAVVASGVSDPVMRNLAISGITGNGIEMLNVTGTSTIDSTVTITSADGVALLVEGGSGTANLAPTITNDTGQSVSIRNRTSGDLTMSGAVTDTGDGVFVENNGGSVLFSGVMALTTTTSNAVHLKDNTGTVNFSGGLDIETTSGTGFLAEGGSTVGVLGTNTIDTTTGVGLDLKGMTIAATDVLFDSVNVTSGATTGINLDTLDGDGEVRVGAGINPGDGGTLTVAGTAVAINNANQVTLANVTTSSADGMLATNSAGDKLFVSGINVTASGTGFSVEGGELTATASNNISTTAGTALKIKDAVITTAAIFDNVSVSAGTVTAIDLENVSGEAVTVGPDTGTAGDGGTIVTSATAISVKNVDKAVFNDVTATSSAGDTFVYDTAPGLGRMDLTLKNNRFTASDNSALTANLSGVGTDGVRFLIDESNVFTNNSGTATTFDVQVTGTRELHATIANSTFTNNGAGDDFSMTSANGNTTVNLHLDGNTANGGAGDFQLNNPASITAGNAPANFKIQDRANVATRNTGTVIFNSAADVIGDFEDITGPVVQP